MAFLKTRFLLLFLLMFALTGCTTMTVQDYQNETPKLDLFDYFSGKTYAQGQFQDRSGKVIRRFTVDITGTIEGNVLTLDEQFLYHDGETQQRIWVIEKTGDNQFVGKAADVIGEATGESAGNALNWRYTLDLPYKDSSIHVQFNDWMYLHTSDTMMNIARVTKWGFNVGVVTLFFSKKTL